MKTSRVKDISKAFNLAQSFDEFLVQLDLMNMSFDTAQKEYSQAHKHWLKYKSSWCSHGVIDFEKLFKTKEHGIPVALPFLVIKKTDKCTFAPRIYMMACRSNGINIEIDGSLELADELSHMSGINMVEEIISSILDELAVKIG